MTKTHSPSPPPPTITLPPRPSFEALFTNGPSAGPEFSPGPMTQLISSFFTDHYPEVVSSAMGSDGLEESDGVKKMGGFKDNRPKELVIGGQLSSGFVFPSVFSPSGFLNSPGFISPLQSPFGMSHQQALAQVTAQAALSHSYLNHIEPENQPSAMEITTEQPQMVNTVNTQSDLEDSQIGSPDEVSVSQSDITEPQQMIAVDTNDGYNWRKYGQKQVKASDHPRSYYRCTYANCTAKKKVGQSLDGHITDIVYKGKHNHDPPPPKRAKEGADVTKPNNSQLETCIMEKPVANQESSQLIDQGYNQLIDQGFNQLIRTDEPNDEPNPKRRNTEVRPVESALSNKMVPEPKIVVQTKSEVDLLNDGFKWRKYGQKVVKGNTNPRSYYKCTSAGCNVRKHVERSPSDPKSVITTYEGKHNHEIPVSKHRGYFSNNGGGQMGQSTKPSQRNDTKLGNSERPVLLQMKEEAITA